MNKIIIILFISLNCFATNQIRDRIRYDRHTEIMMNGPTLKHYMELKNFPKPKRKTTACHRGYIAKWEIKNKALYLRKVKMMALNASDFNFKEFEGSKANWFSGEILIIRDNKNKGRPDFIKTSSVYLKIENGNVVKEFESCMNKWSGDLYRIGRSYFDDKDYLHAAAALHRLLFQYQDFFKNDIALLYYVSSLRWLGLKDHSVQQFDSLFSKYSRSQAVIQFKDRLKILQSGKNIVEELKKPEYKTHTPIFLPWLFELNVDENHLTQIKDIIDNELLFEGPCPENKVTPGKPSFKQSDLNTFYKSYLN